STTRFSRPRSTRRRRETRRSWPTRSMRSSRRRSNDGSSASDKIYRMHVTAIIAAGGRGRRFGAAEPKQLLSIGGRPILERSVEAFTSHPSVNEVIVALPDDLAADPPAYLRSAKAFALRIVAGGARRHD